MSLLRCTEVKKSFGELNVLRGVSLEISPGEKVGLVGNNGEGKTTLADILFGDIDPDGGSIIRYNPRMKVGYMRQATSYTINSFNAMMVEDHPEGTKDFLETASQMGLEKVSLWDSHRFMSLSAGERTKLALAHVWVTGPDLLILDEPTNHMDFLGVEWLVEEIKSYPGTCLIISHNRWFMDQVVTRIYELEQGRTKEYAGNYSYYREEKQRQFEANLHHYMDEQKEQRRIEQEINRLKQWSAKAHREAGKEDGMLKEAGRMRAKKMDKRTKSRIKMLEKKQREGTQLPHEERKPEFEIESSAKRGRRIVEAQNLSKGFDNPLFRNSNFYIQRGEKIGVIGPNGCGKTTLLRILLGAEKQDNGKLWTSPTLKPGYLSQDVADMGTEKNALEYLGVTQKQEVTRARTMLANMGFDAAMITKPVGKLSLGERTRLKLAAMILQENDLLILDEPTNHLDLHSREQLEETLLDYNGTIIIVSHDRYLLERVCEKLLIFQDREIKKLETGFKSFREESNRDQKKRKEEEALVIETRMAWIVNELGRCTPDDPEYADLDQEFKELAKKKRELAES